MRRGRREGRSGENDREAFALLAFCIEFRLVGQAFESEYDRSDERSGGENPAGYGCIVLRLRACGAKVDPSPWAEAR